MPPTLRLDPHYGEDLPAPPRQSRSWREALQGLLLPGQSGMERLGYFAAHPDRAVAQWARALMDLSHQADPGGLSGLMQPLAAPATLLPMTGEVGAMLRQATPTIGNRLTTFLEGHPETLHIYPLPSGTRSWALFNPPGIKKAGDPFTWEEIASEGFPVPTSVSPSRAIPTHTIGISPDTVPAVLGEELVHKAGDLRFGLNQPEIAHLPPAQLEALAKGSLPLQQYLLRYYQPNQIGRELFASLPYIQHFNPAAPERTALTRLMAQNRPAMKALESLLELFVPGGGK